jgi:hypothetical protein
MKTHPEARRGLGRAAIHGRQAETRGESSALIDKYPAYRKRAPVGPLLRLEVGGSGTGVP